MEMNLYIAPGQGDAFPAPCKLDDLGKDFQQSLAGVKNQNLVTNLILFSTDQFVGQEGMMEIHSPHPIHSLKDFLLQLLTITIGILIALTLEGTLERAHHRRLIHEAEANLSTEIHENQVEINQGMQALRTNEQQLKQMVALIHKLQQNRATPVGNISFSWTLDELHATSWNTAGATGALAYMDYGEVKRYTRVYDLQREFMAVQNRAFDSIVAVYGLSTLLQKDTRKLGDSELSHAESVLGLALANAGAVENVESSLNEEYTKLLQKR
jgi:hypothetical protein